MGKKKQPLKITYKYSNKKTFDECLEQVIELAALHAVAKLRDKGYNISYKK